MNDDHRRPRGQSQGGGGGITRHRRNRWGCRGGVAPGWDGGGKTQPTRLAESCASVDECSGQDGVEEGWMDAKDEGSKEDDHSLTGSQSLVVYRAWSDNVSCDPFLQR